ncbi:glycerophosphodiester phosphodiesterase domain-containing protein 5-like [Haliotis rufescens]|uniref:glycerophosphodiester phosphodiesterase domain-containing protein 5-like n=1 Tax=Haliotis rufescens TaxID=6454 RepID=UPI00201F0572|nr:glycerophosphodiester phosphodiesterase domain-containing protein 5-like [Haliotis rufescens]
MWTKVKDFGKYLLKMRDLFWFSLFCLTFLYIIFYFYFWLIVKNSFDDLNWHMFGLLRTWVPWYRIILGLTCAVFAYFIIVMCLVLCHVLHGHQLYIHPVHIAVILFSLLGCVAITVAVELMWRSEWTLVLLSLRITGPFLQIGAVVLMTLMTWVISLQWFKLSHWALKLLWLTVYVAVMIGLYISPYFINSPCVTHADNLPSKPLVLAHRGASEILPENTLMAYEFAYQDGGYGVESDVQISLDCVPFILHDRSLERTTNIKDVFPDRVNDDPSSFNMSDLKALNAGSWFIQNDPFWTAGDLTDAQRKQVANQTLPTLEELARLGRNYSDNVLMFDLRAPPQSHPCFNLTVNYTIQALTRAGFPLQNVWWLQTTFNNSRPTGVTVVGEYYIPVSSLRKANMSIVNVQYTELTDDQIEEYQASNISINMWTVNSEWMYSLCWCMGISSVTADSCHTLRHVQAPIWHLVPSSYLILWVTVDVLSAVIVITVFIVQRIRLYGTSFSPETISLNSATRSAQGHRSRNMKEKLLYNMTDGDLVEEVEARAAGHGGVVNQPASSYSMASINNDPYASQYHNGNTFPDSKYEVE